MKMVEISDEELNKILIKDFGKRNFIAEWGWVASMMKPMIKGVYPIPKNIKELNKLYEQHEYQTAYDKLHRMRMVDNKAKWYIDDCLIVLCYFKLNKPEEAKQFIESLSYITEDLPQVIMAIAGNVGAKYIPGNINRSVDSSSD